MAVEKNDFRNFLARNFTFAAQSQHVFGVFALTDIARTGLAGKERLEPFFAQIIQQRDGRNVGVAFAAGFMLFLREDARNEAHQFVIGQRTLFTDDVGRTENGR